MKAFARKLSKSRRRAEYGFGEHGFKHRELSELFGPHRVPGRELGEFLFDLLFVGQSELTEFFLAELTEFAPKLSEAQ